MYLTSSDLMLFLYKRQVTWSDMPHLTNYNSSLSIFLSIFRRSASAVVYLSLWFCFLSISSFSFTFTISVNSCEILSHLSSPSNIYSIIFSGLKTISNSFWVFPISFFHLWHMKRCTSKCLPGIYLFFWCISRTLYGLLGTEWNKNLIFLCMQKHHILRLGMSFSSRSLLLPSPDDSFFSCCLTVSVLINSFDLWNREYLSCLKRSNQRTCRTAVDVRYAAVIFNNDFLCALKNLSLYFLNIHIWNQTGDAYNMIALATQFSIIFFAFVSGSLNRGISLPILSLFSRVRIL